MAYAGDSYMNRLERELGKAKQQRDALLKALKLMCETAPADVPIDEKVEAFKGAAIAIARAEGE